MSQQAAAEYQQARERFLFGTLGVASPVRRIDVHNTRNLDQPGFKVRFTPQKGDIGGRVKTASCGAAA
jgi:hypothetical protein